MTELHNKKDRTKHNIAQSMLENYYSNTPDTTILINADNYSNIIKWTLFALANTKEYDRILFDLDIDSKYIRELISRCHRINICEYFGHTYSHYKDSMYTWLQSRCIEPLPTSISSSDIHYFKMSSLILNTQSNLYNLPINASQSSLITINSSNVKWEVIRAMYKSSINNVVYSAIFMALTPILDYQFNPSDPYAMAADYPFICLDVPNNNNRLMEIIGGIIFRPLTHLYVGMDDLLSIAKHYGYEHVINSCAVTNW